MTTKLKGNLFFCLVPKVYVVTKVALNLIQSLKKWNSISFSISSLFIP